MSSFDEKQNIPYLELDHFLAKYPLYTPLLGEGTYGRVYPSGSEVAVKVIRDNLSNFMLELHVYSLVVHPCILKPLAWSFSKGRGYLALPRGMCICQAYEEKLITLEEVVADTLSAIAYLNRLGYAHADIKLNNLLWYQGRAVIIDMGMTKRLRLHRDGKLYFHGVAYALHYRDPEYVYLEWNNVNAELYALAVLYYSLLKQGLPPSFSESYSFRSGVDWLDSIFAKAQLLQSERPTAEEIFLSLPSELQARQPIVMVYQEYKPEAKCQGYCSLRVKVYNWVVEIARKENHRSETLFAALSLAYRCFPDPLVIRTQPFFDPLQLKLFALLCLDISSHLLDDRTLLLEGPSGWLSQCGEEYSLYQHYPLYVNIMRVTRGVLLLPTYWDYASSREDLLPLLSDMYSCRYDVNRIRELKSGTTKYVRLDKVITNTSYKSWTAEREIPFQTTSQVQPAELVLRLPLDVFIEFSKKLDFKEYGPAFILHNRHLLASLRLDFAQDLYQRLYQERRTCKPILDLVCRFDWECYELASIWHNKIHPFSFVATTETGLTTPPKLVSLAERLYAKFRD